MFLCYDISMRYIAAQNTHPRFKWELDVFLTNVYGLDDQADVVVLFAVDSADDPVYKYILDKWGHKAEVHAYKDTRRQRTYVASTRPFLWYCYLSEDPSREKDTYFQVDTDIIFRELPDWSSVELSKSKWAGSLCEGYLGADYIKKCKHGDDVLDNFAKIIGIDRAVIERQEEAGAQWVLVEPTAEYWLKVQDDCHKLSGYLDTVGGDIQIWVAEMWAQLFNAPLFGAEYKVSDELAFCWPMQPIQKWHDTKILHNTGLFNAPERHRCFDKTKYSESTPFSEDFSWVGEDLCSAEYIKAIKSVKL